MYIYTYSAVCTATGVNGCTGGSQPLHAVADPESKRARQLSKPQKGPF